MLEKGKILLIIGGIIGIQSCALACKSSTTTTSQPPPATTTTSPPTPSSATTTTAASESVVESELLTSDRLQMPAQNDVVSGGGNDPLDGNGGSFILGFIDMDDKTFEECSYCDARSDRVGTRATADALRAFMTKNHVKVVVDSGEVKLAERFPNEKINTGHSCTVTAEARDIQAEVLMLPNTVELDPIGILYLDEVQNSIAVADVRHSLKVDLAVRMWLGTKALGSCKNLARKTCKSSGYSEGVNHISVNLAASNVITECIAGQEHLTFTIDARVFDEAKNKTYAPVKITHHRSDCHLGVDKIKLLNLDDRLVKYTTRYFDKSARFRELRGPKLVAELEHKLQVKLGSTVHVKLNNIDGTPRVCSPRQKRAANCLRKACPEGYTRIGNTEKCQKYFGLSKPDCAKEGATLFSKPVSPSMSLYWCHKFRVPV